MCQDPAEHSEPVASQGREGGCSSRGFAGGQQDWDTSWTGSAAPEGISALRGAEEAAQTFSSFPREKGRLGNPKTPALMTAWCPHGKEEGKWGERSYLYKQQQGSSPCLSSFYRNPNRKPFALEDGSSGRVGLWLPPGTGHHPHSPWPQHTAIYCSGVDSNH